MEKFFTIFIFFLLGSCIAEEISFFNDDGHYSAVTIVNGGCFTFQPRLVRTWTVVEIDEGCFHLFREPECRGESRTVRTGSHNLKDIGYEKAVSSVELCRKEGMTQVEGGSPAPQETQTMPHRNLQRNQNQYSQQEIWDVAVEEHNKYRRQHGGLPDVKGNIKMHEDAQKWADYLVSSGKFEPTTMGLYGNNIATSFRRDKLDALKEAIRRWYSKDTNNTKGRNFELSAGTTEIGIGVAWDEGKKNWVLNAFYSIPYQYSGDTGYYTNSPQPQSGRA